MFPSQACVQTCHLSCKCTVCYVCKHGPSSNRTRPSYKFTTGIASFADPQRKRVLESDALVSWVHVCLGWGGGLVLVGGRCKVAIYVDTWTQKAVIQAHQLHSSQRMCQQLREVSATWRELASAVFHSLVQWWPRTLCHVTFLDRIINQFSCAFKHLLSKWTSIIESGWTVKSIMCKIIWRAWGWFTHIIGSYVLRDLWW